LFALVHVTFPTHCKALLEREEGSTDITQLGFEDCILLFMVCVHLIEEVELINESHIGVLEG
jgi:hypothetical protein